MKRFVILMIIAVLLCSAALAEGARQIDYVYADRAAGVEYLMSNDAYYAGFSQNELDFKMQKRGATMEEYQAFSREQVLDFTDAEKAFIDREMDGIETLLREQGIALPPLETVVFIRTTMAEECYPGSYTHGTQIYIGGAYFHDTEEYRTKLRLLLTHELFHCLTRNNPDFRRQMYDIIHFTVGDKDFPIPDSVREYFISNPDVERHDAQASFLIDGEYVDCFTAMVTTKHFEAPGDRFFDCITTALVPVDGSDRYYVPEDAANFDDVFGRNTGYVIDPEECMADNFQYAIVFGPEGKHYPNPEIIEGILDVLKGSAA